MQSIKATKKDRFNPPAPPPPHHHSFAQRSQLGKLKPRKACLRFFFFFIYFRKKNLHRSVVRVCINPSIWRTMANKWDKRGAERKKKIGFNSIVGFCSVCLTQTNRNWIPEIWRGGRKNSFNQNFLRCLIPTVCSSTILLNKSVYQVVDNQIEFCFVDQV